jgi:gliding motility-associated-like protein
LIIAQNYFLNGDAQFDAGNCYTITPNVAWQNGTVWYAQQLNLNQPFSLEFEMNFGSVDANGADGMVFVLQTVGTSAIGLDGGGMGFQGFNPSFGIEFDTFSNTETSDLVSDHVAFLRNGVIDHNSANNLAGPVQASSTSANIEDGQEHIIRITWNPQTQIVELFFDCVMRLSDQNNLINNIFGGNATVYWGFTGATGFYFNEQTVCLQEYYYQELSDTTICMGQSVPLAAPGNPAGTYLWTPAASLDDATSQTPVATPDATTEYCYTYTDVCGNEISNCLTVFVESPPVISAGDDDVFCEGDILTLVGSCDQPDANFTWSTSDGETIGGTSDIDVDVVSGGLYFFEASSVGAGCPAVDVIEITEIPLPVFVPDSPQNLCPGESVILSAGNNWDAVLWANGSTETELEVAASGSYNLTITEEGCSIEVVFEINQIQLPEIYLGEDFEICGGESATITSGEAGIWSTGEVGTFINVNAQGDYIFTYTQENCVASDTINVVVVNPPVFDLGPDFSLCEGDTTTLAIPYDGTWSTGDNGSEVLVTESGVYQVNVGVGPCSVTDAVQVSLLQLPVVDLGEDATYCVGTEYTIGANDAMPSVYLWSTGDTTSTIEVRSGGDYWLQALNQCGAAADTVLISFDECDYTIYVPSAFTPNDDGLNDVFFIYVDNLIKPELNIYNRWGIVVFTTTDMQVPWVGDMQGGTHFAPDGVYNYQLKFLTEDGDAGDVRGHITLLR